MTKTFICLLILLFMIMNFLIACSGGAELEPTFTVVTTKTEIPSETPLPTLTNTYTPEPTHTPVPTVTPTPTETEIPQPATFTGTIYLAANSITPFVTSVELRLEDSFELVNTVNTNSSGIFNMVEIHPGIYNLWILISATNSMVPGCNDVFLQESGWKIGIKFGEDKAVIGPYNSLQNAITFVDLLDDSVLQATGIYAVFEGFEIRSGIENEMDVTLFCR